MKKQDFTIEGSVALKKAFIEECGVGMHEVFFGIFTLDEYKYLINSDKGFAGINSKCNLNFNLNTQYGEALEYVREYFKPEEPEFKVGDYIIPIGCTKETVRIITNFDIIENDLHWSEKEDLILIHSWPLGKIRHATPEEIEDYNNPKLPTINGYEGKLVDKMIVYGNDCAKIPTKWFKDTFGATRHIKSMVLSSGVEINEEQMNKIRKVVNAKTK